MTLKSENATEVTLESLIGLHKLDAVDVGSVKIKQYEWREEEEANALSFRLDKIVYTALEDPSDGYRSSMERLFIEKKRMKNVSPAIKVMGIMKPTDWHENNTLQFYDVTTGKLVLEVGTDRADDYYPSFVANFMPQNMITNAEVEP